MNAQTTHPDRTAAIEKYIRTKEKSPAGAFLLALLLGPAAASDHNARIRAEAELLAGGAS